MVAAAALVITAVVVAVFVHLVGVARLGWGPKLALAGAVLLALSAGLPLCSRSPG